MGEIMVADVRSQVQLSLFTDFENFSTFKPHERHTEALNMTIDQVIQWAEALKKVRETAQAA